MNKASYVTERFEALYKSAPNIKAMLLSVMPPRSTVDASPEVGMTSTPSLKSFESLRLRMSKNSVSSFAAVYLFLILLLVVGVTNRLAFSVSDSKYRKVTVLLLGALYTFEPKQLSQTHKMVWIHRGLQDHPVLAPLSGTGTPSSGIHFWLLHVALTSGGVFKLILAVSIAVWYLGERKGVLM